MGFGSRFVVGLARIVADADADASCGVPPRPKPDSPLPFGNDFRQSLCVLGDGDG